MNLSTRFLNLKKQVGGNREKRNFEFTFGMSVAEQNRITEPSPAIRRILAELNFALQLSKRNNGLYDGEISAALDILEACMQEENVITKSSAIAAEEKLLRRILFFLN